MTLNSTMPQETATILWSGGTITSTPLTLGDPSPSNFTFATKGMPNATGNAIANVPEPGTLALFLTGIGALLTRRRLRGEVRS
jgi:hypothetical protein